MYSVSQFPRFLSARRAGNPIRCATSHLVFGARLCLTVQSRQLAGRAGRQQNGQYFCILSKVRREILPYNGGPAIERGDNSSM